MVLWSSEVIFFDLIFLLHFRSLLNMCVSLRGIMSKDFHLSIIGLSDVSTGRLCLMNPMPYILITLKLRCH